MSSTRIVAMLCLVSIAACGGRGERDRMTRAKGDASAVAQDIAKTRANAGGGEATSPTGDGQIAPRKIVRNADLGLTVVNADAFLRAVEGLASRSGGFVADRQVQHDGQRVQGGTLVLRVPAERLDGASESLRALGTVESESIRAEDISEQYYDLDSRLKNARNLEARLLKLLAERAGQLSDVIAMETKLGEVREQIERLEGRQRLWDNQVALATVRISFHVPLPVTPIAEASFLADLRSTFSGSLAVLGAVSRGFVFFLTALAPWSPLIIGAILLLRRMLRRERAVPSGS